MRLLHVIPYYLPETAHGGPVQAVHGLCRALTARGHAVRVLTTANDAHSSVMDGVHVEAFQRHPPARLFRAPALEHTLDAALTNCDLVHVHGVYTWPAWIAARLAHARRIPCVLSPHGMLMRAAIGGRSHWLKSLWIYSVERARFQAAAAVHFSSELEQREYTALAMPTTPAFVVPHGVHQQACHSGRSEESESSRPTVLFLGRLCWIKGLDRLLAALALLPDVELILAGPDEDGYAAQLRPLALRLGVSQRIRWIGYADDAVKRRLFAEASLLVLPSYSENFGMVVLEAWAAGKPVLVTPEVGLAATVASCGGGLVSDGDPVSLAAALKKMLDDPERRRRCAAVGREIIAREFAWPVVAANMETHYLHLIRNRNDESRQ